jgi:Predicted metallopeptidase (DUF2201).
MSAKNAPKPLNLPTTKPTPVEAKNAHDSLLKARIRLIQHNPFFGSLALNLTLIEKSDGGGQGTLGVDTRGRCYYNPHFINHIWKQNEKALEFILCHEIMHLAEHHHDRCGHRNPNIWNCATDYAINQMLVDAGFQMPADSGLLDAKYKGLPSEAIYVRIKDEIDKSGKDGPSMPGGPGAGQCGSCAVGGDDKDGKGEGQSKDPDGGEGVAPHEWPVHVAAAAALAKQRGKLPAGMDRYIDAIITPKLDWKKILAKLLRVAVSARSGRDDYSYARVSRRAGAMERIFGKNAPIMAATVGHDPGEVLIAIDTSGSIGPNELQSFASEAIAVVQQVGRPCRVLYCDAQIASEVKIDGTDFRKLIKAAKGGGGTDYRPVFEHADKLSPKPCAVIYLGDMYASFPDHAPKGYKSIFVSTTDVVAPFGKTIKLNLDELKR